MISMATFRASWGCCLLAVAVLLGGGLLEASTQGVEDRSELRHRYAAPAPVSARRAQARPPVSEPVVAPPDASVSLSLELPVDQSVTGLLADASADSVVEPPVAPSVLVAGQGQPASRPIWVANRLRMDPADVAVLRAAAHQPTIIIVRPQSVVVNCGCCSQWGCGYGGQVIRYQNIGYFSSCWTQARWYRSGYGNCGRWGERDRGGFSLRYRSGSESSGRFSVRTWSRF